jgi:hypothetical protein
MRLADAFPLMWDTIHTHIKQWAKLQVCILEPLYTFRLQTDKIFWTELWQAVPEFDLILISSYMQIWFVSVIPKYLNYAIFSNNLLAIFTLWFSPLHEAQDMNTYLSLQYLFLDQFSYYCLIKRLCFSSYNVLVCFHPTN